LKDSVDEGEIPVRHLQPPVHGIHLASHIPWHWNANCFNR